MNKVGYYNGKMGPLDEMMVPMNDRVCYFGDGVYEACMVRNGKIFALEDHLDRFYNSAGLIKMNVGKTREELTDILYQVINASDCKDLMLYWQLTRGTGNRQHQFLPEDVPSNLWAFVKPAKMADPSHKLKLISIEDTRFLHCNIKTLNLLPNVMAAQQTEMAGCDECIFHRGEIVTECAHSNVSILKDGVFKTHPTDHYILPGITRLHLIQLCKANGIPVDETPFTVEELKNADEIIVSSTTKFCAQAVELDGQKIGGKDQALFDKLQKLYYDKYLTETN